MAVMGMTEEKKSQKKEGMGKQGRGSEARVKGEQGASNGTCGENNRRRRGTLGKGQLEGGGLERKGKRV